MSAANDNVLVKKIWQQDQRTLAIVWTDDRSTLYDVVELRRRCPCAVCIDEWTREQRLRPADVKDEVRPVRIESVGRYALSIRFSDGHGTGIYTFKMLRELGNLH